MGRTLDIPATSNVVKKLDGAFGYFTQPPRAVLQPRIANQGKAAKQDRYLAPNESAIGEGSAIEEDLLILESGVLNRQQDKPLELLDGLSDPRIDDAHVLHLTLPLGWSE